MSFQKSNIGDKVTGDKVTGDKVTRGQSDRDKVTGDKVKGDKVQGNRIYVVLLVLSDKSATLCTCCKKGRNMYLCSTFTTGFE
jgi:hypothetical protein